MYAGSPPFGSSKAFKRWTESDWTSLAFEAQWRRPWRWCWGLVLMWWASLRIVSLKTDVSVLRFQSHMEQWCHNNEFFFFFGWHISIKPRQTSVKSVWTNSTRWSRPRSPTLKRTAGKHSSPLYWSDAVIQSTQRPRGQIRLRMGFVWPSFKYSLYLLRRQLSSCECTCLLFMFTLAKLPAKGGR